MSVYICAFMGQPGVSNCSVAKTVTVSMFSTVVSMVISFTGTPPHENAGKAW